MSDVLELFGPATRECVRGRVQQAPAAQAGGWRAGAAGQHPPVAAPPRAGKTLAAFLWALDRLAAEPKPDDPQRRCRVLYVSPLKALAVDVERNLRAADRHPPGRPGACMSRARHHRRDPVRRHAGRRARGGSSASPPDILITTPESLFLMLTSQARESLRGVETVIVDEVHAVAGTKRGAHLASPWSGSTRCFPSRPNGSACRPPCGRSTRSPGSSAASAGPGGPAPGSRRRSSSRRRPGRGLSASSAATTGPGVSGRRTARRSGRTSRSASSTWSRRTARRSSSPTPAAWPSGSPPGSTRSPTSAAPARSCPPAGACGRGGHGPGRCRVGRRPRGPVARAHHGSVSKEQRAAIEEALKAGRLPAVVATSILELGIDMGAVDLVVQVESPPSVASGLQRVGRAGHQVGAVSRGVLFPKYRGDLVQTAVVAERMREGADRGHALPAQPARRARPAGRRDGGDGRVGRRRPARRGQRARARNACPQSGVRGGARHAGRPLPERRVRRAAAAARVGPGRRHAHRPPRRPAAGGDQRRHDPRPRAVRRLPRRREAAARGSASSTRRWCTSRGSATCSLSVRPAGGSRTSPTTGCSSRRRPASRAAAVLEGRRAGPAGRAGRGARRVLRELSASVAGGGPRRARPPGWTSGRPTTCWPTCRAARGDRVTCPTTGRSLVERFRDELGDWRVAIHSPFGAQVHAPWALAIGGAAAGAVRRRRAGDARRRRHRAAPARHDRRGRRPGRRAGRVRARRGRAAGHRRGRRLGAVRLPVPRVRGPRAAAPPRRDPGRRTPLWQQRQRSAQLLSVASEYGSFPIVLETMRECLQDVFDVPGLVQLMRDLAVAHGAVGRGRDAAAVALRPVAAVRLRRRSSSTRATRRWPSDGRRRCPWTPRCSPSCSARGHGELRELLDLDAMESLARSCSGSRRPAGPRRRGRRRPVAHPRPAVDRRGGRARRDDRLAGRPGGGPAGDPGPGRRRGALGGGRGRGRLRDALGAPLPVGVPEAFLEPVATRSATWSPVTRAPTCRSTPARWPALDSAWVSPWSSTRSGARRRRAGGGG